MHVPIGLDVSKTSKKLFVKKHSLVSFVHIKTPSYSSEVFKNSLFHMPLRIEMQCDKSENWKQMNFFNKFVQSFSEICNNSLTVRKC